ncbi:MAG: sialate O-acetylesterase [Bacteroidales bacterium]|nr:sialate O-acetylesterase [Bacteroidales bacterium]
MKKIFLLIALFFCFSGVKAEIKLPKIIGSDMVIQQNADVRFWGKATKNAKVEVSVSWDSQKFNTQADKDGKFFLTVNTKNFTFEPQTIKFTDLSDKKSVELSNILIGEVWLASGQSNMQMPLKGFPGCNIEDGFEEIMFSGSQADRVRFFTVPLKHSYNLEEAVEAEWTLPSAKTSTEYSAVAWHYAKALSYALGCPVGIVSAAYGGTLVESWMNKQLLEQHGVSTKKEDIENVEWEYEKILLPYNAMFWPIHQFTYKGVIWYQGCSNVGKHQTYYQRLKDMISLWRSDIGLGDIPFFMVEIAPYDYGSGDAPFLREVQLKVAKEVKNSGLVTTSDLVLPQERHNIHPRQKKAVGQRLAALALNKTYGMETFISSGPTFKEMIVEKNEAFIGFDNLQMGLCSNYMIEGFEVAGEDKKFYPADKVWLRWQTNHVAVSSEKVEKPVAVRYCFKDFYTGKLLYGGGMIPAYPFRTDNWDDVK